MRIAKFHASGGWIAIAIGAVLAFSPSTRAGQVVGDIQVVYNDPSPYLFNGRPLGIYSGAYQPMNHPRLPASINPPIGSVLHFGIQFKNRNPSIFGEESTY